MKILYFCRKFVALIAVMVAVCNTMSAYADEPVSYDTLTLCRSELPVMYDTHQYVIFSKTRDGAHCRMNSVLLVMPMI